MLSVNTMKTENEHNEFRTRVVKYLSGEMLTAERNEFEQLLASDSAKKELFDSYRKIWDGAEMAAESNRYDLDEEWSRFSDVLDRRAGRLRLEPFRRSFLRVAAAILIGLAGVGGMVGCSGVWRV